MNNHRPGYTKYCSTCPGRLFCLSRRYSAEYCIACGDIVGTSINCQWVLHEHQEVLRERFYYIYCVASESVLQGFRDAWIQQATIEEAVELVGSRTIWGRRYPLIIDPHAMHALVNVDFVLCRPCWLYHVEDYLRSTFGNDT